jgi:hypothetical protein
LWVATVYISGWFPSGSQEADDKKFSGPKAKVPGLSGNRKCPAKKKKHTGSRKQRIFIPKDLLA